MTLLTTDTLTMALLTMALLTMALLTMATRTGARLRGGCGARQQREAGAPLLPGYHPHDNCVRQAAPCYLVITPVAGGERALRLLRHAQPATGRRGHLTSAIVTPAIVTCHSNLLYLLWLCLLWPGHLRLRC